MNTKMTAEKIPGKGAKRLLVGLCLLCNFALLMVFRYFPVWEKLINEALGGGLARVRLDVARRWNLAAPIGISFYTLQAAGYLLDTASGRCRPVRHPGKYAAFVSFFPNLSSGPIERAGHFLPQLEAARRSLPDVQIIAAFIDAKPTRALALLNKHNLRLDAVYNALPLAKSLGVDGVPMLFLFDAKHQLIKTFDGYDENRSEDIKQAAKGLEKEVNMVSVEAK